MIEGVTILVMRNGVDLIEIKIVNINKKFKNRFIIIYQKSRDLDSTESLI